MADLEDCIIYDAIIELFRDTRGNPELEKDGLLYIRIQMDCDVIMQGTE